METRLYNVTSNSEIADELGSLRAEIKQLQDSAKALEAILKETGESDFDGDLYHVSISYGVETNRVDWKSVAAKFNPSRQLVTAHTNVTVSDRVRVTAHRK